MVIVSLCSAKLFPILKLAHEPRFAEEPDGADVPCRGAIQVGRDRRLRKGRAPPKVRNDLFSKVSADEPAIAGGRVITNATSNYDFVCSDSHWFIRSPTSHISAWCLVMTG